MTTIHGYKIHPTAAAFPLIEGGEYASLVASVRSSGLRDPIAYILGADASDQVIVDGRNRLRACIDAGVKPTFTCLQAKDVETYIIDKNLHRRHLTESQRAMVAATIANIRNGANQHSKNDGVPIGTPSMSIDSAAKKMKVGRRTAARAKKVKSRGTDELVSAVMDGGISVSAAAEIADLKPDAQRAEIAKRKTKTQAPAAKRSAVNWDDRSLDRSIAIVDQVERECMKLPPEYRLGFINSVQARLSMVESRVEGTDDK